MSSNTSPPLQTDASSETASPADQSTGSIVSTIDADDLIVVSNRQPYRHEHDYDESGRCVTVDRPAGGLTAALDPVLQRIDGTWIAWGDGDADRSVVDSEDAVRVPPDDPAYTLKRLWLTDGDIENYYYGFSNQVLWPLCHGFREHVRFSPEFWRTYRRVNEKFANTVVDHADDQSLIWFQDHHLGLAPRQVRSQVSNAFLIHFWHIPWPEWPTFQACPHKRKLLEGLLGNDLLGFHIDRYREHFLDCVDAALETAVIDRAAGIVDYKDHSTAIRAFPMDEPPRVTSTMATNALTSHVLSSDDDGHGPSNSLPDGIDFDQFDNHISPVME